MSIAELPDLLDPAACPRLVVKVGSSLLVDPEGEVRAAWLGSLVEELAEARQRGQQVLVVSSGAIALGAATLGFAGRGRESLADAQAAAAVGQVALARLWSGLFADHDCVAAQLLVTLHDLEDRRRYLNATATLGRLLGAGAVPIANENDSVATEEIRFGDNDRLAARIAQAAEAQAVVLLSDVPGLFDRAPDKEGAELVRRVEGVTPDIHAMADAGSGSGLGSGGMTSKLQAAEIAERAGIATAIIDGRHERPLARAIDKDEGTIFLPRRNDAARKAWLGGRLATNGTLRVDSGCADALRGGASLLAAGVVGVSGRFRRGDLVSIVTLKGEPLAQGLAEYDAGEVQAIAGKREGEQAERLGYAPRAAVVHRDHMVLL